MKPQFDDDGEPLDYCPYCEASDDEDHDPMCPMADYPFDLEVEIDEED